MTMVIENQGRHYGAMSYDMYSNQIHPPQFSDPWGSHPANQAAYSSMNKQDLPRPTTLSMPYSQIPTTTPLSSDISRSYGTDAAYSSASAANSYPASTYPPLSYAQSLHQQQQQQQHRKLSDANENSRAANASFGELDASRGMLALSHQNLADLTPRNIYEARAQRGSTDSYGFPSTSSQSSISGASGRDYPYYTTGSVASVDSATDYSSSASDVAYDSLTASRTLPRPTQLIGANLGPPAPQSMMGQFSSKMSSNTQKKHKCKVCDKRFTRPSSLQTHMYSHTGEKPFACDVEGCGRHFSVVSNLRRHKKVHKGESVSSHSDDED